jgi:hypothetical protein
MEATLDAVWRAWQVAIAICLALQLTVSAQRMASALDWSPLAGVQVVAAPDCPGLAFPELAATRLARPEQRGER